MGIEQSNIGHIEKASLSSMSREDFKKFHKKVVTRQVKIMKKQKKRIWRRVRMEGVLAVFFRNAEALKDAYDPLEVELIEDGVKRGLCG